MKLILLVVVMFFATGVAMALLARLTRTQSQIADLHKKLARTDEELLKHKRDLEQLHSQSEERDEDTLKS